MVENYAGVVSVNEENNVRKFGLLGVAVLILMTLILGCNAFRGAGQDLSDTGKHLENVGK